MNSFESSGKVQLNHGDRLSQIKRRLPSKLFSKKIIPTKRLVASSQVFHNTIPTSDCDVLVTFPIQTDTSTLMWLLDRLRSRAPSLIVHVRHHSNTKGSVFHLTATYEGLLKGAEELGLQKLLKEDYGGGMKEFTFEDQECFKDVEDESLFFNSQERQNIIRHILYNLRATNSDQLGKVKFVEGQSIVPYLESKKIISQVFPLHCKIAIAELRKEWVQALFRRQPLDKIKDYFGVKISMYFAYLGHYTLALCIPAVVGGVIWFFQGEDDERDDQLLMAFALFNAFWATLYLEHWKRKCSELAYRWGTLDSKGELLEDPRPLFSGRLEPSPVTGRLEPYYPSWKRNLFYYFVSCPVIFFCLIVVFIVMLLIFQVQEWINDLIKKEDVPGFFSFIPKILLAVSIGILDEIYKTIAYWLNMKENYRMEETYENQLIIKLALFQFVNSFLSLFYIAFYLQDMDRLRDQLAAILITRQIIGNIKEAFLPFVQWKARLYKVGYEMTKEMSSQAEQSKEFPPPAQQGSDNKNNSTELETNSFVNKEETCEMRQRKSETDTLKDAQNDPSCSPNTNLSLTQAEVESAMKKYEDTFEDYLEMFIQFGYVTLFSSAFPLAAVCALLNNVVEIRSDAFKLCINHQRPFGKQVENIGTWQDALEIMGVIAVIVNCALIGVSGQVQRMLPRASIATVIILIIALEHIILALKFLIAYAIPDIPETIATNRARLEFLRREALKKLELQSQPAACSTSAEIRDKILARQKSRQGSVIENAEDNKQSAERSSCANIENGTFSTGAESPNGRDKL